MMVYISGMISDGGKLSDEAIQANREKFMLAEKSLRRRGFDVVNPIDFPQRRDWVWADYMKANIKTLLACDAICLIYHWWQSEGSRLEFQIATALGMPAMFYPDGR